MELKVSLSVCSHASLSDSLSACQKEQDTEKKHEEERIMEQPPVKLGRRESYINSFDSQHTFPT